MKAQLNDTTGVYIPIIYQVNQVLKQNIFSWKITEKGKRAFDIETTNKIMEKDFKSKMV